MENWWGKERLLNIPSKQVQAQSYSCNDSNYSVKVYLLTITHTIYTQIN